MIRLLRSSAEEDRSYDCMMALRLCVHRRFDGVKSEFEALYMYVPL